MMTFYFWIIQSALAGITLTEGGYAILAGESGEPKFWDTDFGEFLIVLLVCLFLMWLIPKFWRRFGKSLTNNRLVHWMKRETKSTFEFWFGWLKVPEEEEELDEINKILSRHDEPTTTDAEEEDE